MIETRIRLDRLTSLRFFAALIVVLSHTTQELATVPVLTDVATLGTAGVGFFFALSGFILTWSHRDGDTPRAFYRRRFARVYPLHFAMFLVAIPVLLIAGSEFSVGEAVTNVLLVQSWVPNIHTYFGMNSPSWSLSDEFLFYLLFPLIIPVIRRLQTRGLYLVLGGALVLYLVIAVIVSSQVDVSTARFAIYVLPAFRLIGFLAGCAAGRLIQRGAVVRVPFWVAASALVAVYLVIAGAERVFGQTRNGVEDAVLLPFVILVLMTAATADIAGRPGLLRRRALVRLGEWSFALYLTHWLLMKVVITLLPDFDGASVAVRLAANIGFIALAVGVSALAYSVIERPLEKRLRGARPRPEMARASVTE